MTLNQEIFTSTSTDMLALVWLPASKKNNSRTILYLHGAGGFGTGISGLYEYIDFPSLLRDGLELDCRVIIPSCHVGDEWHSLMISSFLDDFEVANGKPQDGYDLLGYSRGGRGAYQFAAAEPSRIRTLAVFSAPNMPELIPCISSLPVFICHSLADQRTPVANAKSMYEDLLVSGCNCRLSLIDGDHYIIAQALQESGIFKWQKDTI